MGDAWFLFYKTTIVILSSYLPQTHIYDLSIIQSFHMYTNIFNAIRKHHLPIMKKFFGKLSSLRLLYVRSKTSRAGKAPKPRGSSFKRLTLKHRKMSSYFIRWQRIIMDLKISNRWNSSKHILTQGSKSSTLIKKKWTLAGIQYDCWRESKFQDWTSWLSQVEFLKCTQKENTHAKQWQWLTHQPLNKNLKKKISPRILLWLRVSRVIWIIFTEKHRFIS